MGRYLIQTYPILKFSLMPDTLPKIVLISYPLEDGENSAENFFHAFNGG